ncbi:mucosa-associated lymphoid tissue lymphoma translocation protein 1 homolog [Amblyomma americanum]|uniref:Caspase domain protein n=1 Tax=Amblyomma americanum TaxID=6943 RepID=A0AAQ4F9H1_AMBAM
MSSLLSHVLSLNQPLTYQLIRALSSNELWRSLRSVIPEDYLSATFSPTSPDDLVLALQSSFVSVADLIRWLELVNAFDALLLLKPDEPVVIEEHPQPRLELEASADAVLRLTCRASSFPPPNYHWFLDGQPLSSKHSVCTGPVLEIHRLTPAHSGSYTCRAWNIRGSEAFSKPCKVIVKSPATHDSASKELAPLSAHDKVALLISNSSYPHDETLPLTENDAESLGKALAALNFRIIAFKNLRKKDTLYALNIFRQFLKAGSYSVFYYAGHGFKEAGRDYIQPVDCDDGAAAGECVCFQEIVEEIRAAPCSLNLIMLDACRDTREQSNAPTVAPSRTDGSKVQHVRRSTIVVYATSPSTSAVEVAGHHNGLFMEHLSKHVGKSASVHEVILQSLKDFERHKLASMQVPVVKYDIPGDHSLSDPILDSEVYDQNNELWRFISSLPPNSEFPIGDTEHTLRIEYSCEKEVFCNSMVVVAAVVPCTPNIHVDLQVAECSGASLLRHSSSVVVVSDLQNVTSPMRLTVIVRNLNSTKTLYHKNIECGWPLVTAWRLRNKYTSAG